MQIVKRACPDSRDPGRQDMHATLASRESGMATLETALMVPVLLAITTVFLSLVSIGMQTLSLSDATRTAARELARGTAQQTVIAEFVDREPQASIELEWTSEAVTIHASKPGDFALKFLNFLPVELVQTHTAPREWMQ